MVSLSPAQPFQRKAVLSFMTGYLHMREFALKFLQEQILSPKVVITISVQRVPEPDPLPGISFDTRPDPIQFEKSSGSG